MHRSVTHPVSPVTHVPPGQSDGQCQGRSEVSGHPGNGQDASTAAGEGLGASPVRSQMDVYSAVRWSAFSKYSAQGMQVVLSIVMARLLAPEYFGLLGMATVITGFVKVLGDLGFQSAIVQRKTVSHELLSTIFWANLAVCTVLAVILVAISPLAAAMYRDPRVAPILAVLSLNFVFSALAMIPSALLTRQMAFDKLAVREVAAIMVQGATAIPLALLGWGVWALVAASLASSTAQMLLINLIYPFRPRLTFQRQTLQECLGFGLNLTGFSIFNYFARNADNLIIGVFLGPIALGYYALAYRLMLMPRDSITQVLTRVLFPAFSRMQDDDDRLRGSYLRACGAIAFVTFPMMTGMAVIAKPLVHGLLGEKWLPAVPVIWILAAVGAIQSVGSTVGQLYLAKGRADWLFRWGVSAGALYVLSFVIGIPWGIIGVALAYALTNLLLSYPLFAIPFRLVRGLHLRDLVIELWPYTWCSLSMAMFVLSAERLLNAAGIPPTAIVMICIPIGALAYSVLALWHKPPALGDCARLAPAGIQPYFARARRLI